MSDGFLLVDKVSGPTSHDVVDSFRRRTRIRKVGHTGTLDPLASGLLVLCVGRATRLQSYLMKLEKEYEGTIRFGFATDTYDAEGKPLGERKPIELASIDLEPLVAEFRGEIEQVPPAYSAKKIAGVRAYEKARKGEEVAMEAKRVTIAELQVRPVAPDRAEFRMRCSAGTYVRSIAHDLGVRVGVGAHLESLRRTKVGAFDLADAIRSDKFSELETSEILEGPHFRSMHDVELPLPAVVIDSMQERKLLSGQQVVLKPDAVDLVAGTFCALTDLDGKLVGIGEVAEVLRSGGPVAIQPKVALRELSR